MECRRQIAIAQAALVMVIAVTAVMTTVALRRATAGAASAHEQLAAELRTRDDVRRRAQRLADAGRRVLIDGSDAQPSRVALRSRELERSIRGFASRAIAIGAKDSANFERDFAG